MGDQRASTIFMFNVLPNDDIFFPFAGGGKTGAQVVNRKYQVVWTYTSTSQQVGGGERLSNGHTLLGEQGPPRALEIDDKGATVAASIYRPARLGSIYQVRHIHRLSNGNTLVAMEGEGVAREFDPKGKVVWEYAAGGAVQDALRVDCGNTFITTGDKKTIVEVTPEGTVAWEFKASDAPEPSSRSSRAFSSFATATSWSATGRAPKTYQACTLSRSRTTAPRRWCGSSRTTAFSRPAWRSLCWMTSNDW